MLELWLLQIYYDTVWAMAGLHAVLKQGKSDYCLQSQAM